MADVYAPPLPNRTLLAQNEFYWPPPVKPADLLDLDAAAQWHRKIGTPTGGVIYTTATAEGISTLYGDVLLKIVAAASGDGWKTTWTYANEKRVKAARWMANLVAVYIVTAARTLTVSQVSSVPTTIATQAVTTVGSWQLVALEPGATALDGTTVQVQATLDGAGTFYVIPLGAVISTAASPLAMALPHRGTAHKTVDGTTVKTLTAIGDEATWTDIDCTSATSALTVSVGLEVNMADNQASQRWILYLRRNGSAVANQNGQEWADITVAVAQGVVMRDEIVCDDSQIFEYYLDRIAGAATLAFGLISCVAYREWA